MKKISFFSVYNLKDKGTSAAVFSELTKHIRCLKFISWSKSPCYKLIASISSQILIIDLTTGPSPQLYVMKSLNIFATGQIVDFAILETGPSTADLLCLGSEQQLGRLKQFDRMLSNN